MFNLQDPNISYMIISPEKSDNSDLENKINCERVCSILYSKDYTIINVTGFYNNKYEKSFIAITSYDNNSLRFDAIYLIDKFNQDSVIVKYNGDKEATKITKDGNEKSLSLLVYNSEHKNRTYLYNGVSFSFLENKKFFFPRKKEELKNGMIIEYFNNNKWNELPVNNLDTQYDKMFKLLMKYDKLRIECK